MASNVDNKMDNQAVDQEVGAAFLAAGVGSLALGVLVVVSEASTSVSSKLAWIDKVGPLSGKVFLTVIAFIVSWVVLHFGLKDRGLRLMTAFVISLVLIALGLLLTFPPVFDMFAPK